MSNNNVKNILLNSFYDHQYVFCMNRQVPLWKIDIIFLSIVLLSIMLVKQVYSPEGKDNSFDVKRFVSAAKHFLFEYIVLTQYVMLCSLH